MLRKEAAEERGKNSIFMQSKEAKKFMLRKEAYNLLLLCIHSCQANHHLCRCHKLVLASCSKFLADLLRSCEEEAALIFTDITNDELELLISFSYTGFVTLNSSCGSQRFKALLNHLAIQLPAMACEEDDLSSLIADEFVQLSSTVDQSAILYEFQDAFQHHQPNHGQNEEDVNKILEEIISDYDKSNLVATLPRK